MEELQMDWITIKNELITAKIDPMGAELKSVVRGSTEFIWEGDPKVWGGTSPVLFPFCGRLIDETFTFKGKEYSLPIHGFASRMAFEVESCEEDRAVFLLKSSEETKKNYPFDFEFRVLFSLDGATLTVSYLIKNCSEGPMYCSVGSHEAYACPEGIEEYTILFDQEEEMDILDFDGLIPTQEKISLMEKSKELPLSDD